MGKREGCLSLQEVMPDLIVNLGDRKDFEGSFVLEELLKDAKKYLSEGNRRVVDVKKFVLAIVKQASKFSRLPVKDALKISDKDIEALYNLTFHLYETAKYKEAANMFRLLVMINHYEFKYVFGLAACLQMQELYSPSAATYTIAATLNPDYAWTHFHAAECYMCLCDPVSAAASLGLAIDASNGQEELSVLKERCILTRKKLIEKINRIYLEEV